MTAIYLIAVNILLLNVIIAQFRWVPNSGFRSSYTIAWLLVTGYQLQCWEIKENSVKLQINTCSASGNWVAIVVFEWPLFFFSTHSICSHMYLPSRSHQLGDAICLWVGEIWSFIRAVCCMVLHGLVRSLEWRTWPLFFALCLLRGRCTLAIFWGKWCWF